MTTLCSVQLARLLSVDSIYILSPRPALTGESHLKSFYSSFLIIYSSDVAIGAQNIVNSCTKSNGRVAGKCIPLVGNWSRVFDGALGSDAANGNGNLIVSIGKPCT